MVFAKHAQKDVQKLAASGLKAKAQELLAVIQENPFQSPPPDEKLVGDLSGAFFALDQHSAPPCLRSAAGPENHQGSAHVVAL